uniref:Uncharacterized protein n=1 Tax=Tanacetum cinerariifolium TaxID=118510 RepID=A0A6L2N4I8_TANCI|nr:hypothetical protein [Tanacetum cinerariifolium]
MAVSGHHSRPPPKNFFGEHFRQTPKTFPVSRSTRSTTPLSITRCHPPPSGSLHHSSPTTTPLLPPQQHHHRHTEITISAVTSPPLSTPHHAISTPWQPPSPLSPSTAGSSLPPAHLHRNIIVLTTTTTTSPRVCVVSS